MPTSSLGHITTVGSKSVTLELGGGAQGTRRSSSSSSSSSSTTRILLMILILLLVAGAGLVIGIFAIDISPSCIAKDGVITVLDTWEAEFKKVGIAYADDDKSKGECKNARKRAYELVSELYVADKSTLTVRFDGGEKRTTQDDIVSYLIGKCIDDEDVKEKNKLYVEGDG
jgi:hypothetical protein